MTSSNDLTVPQLRSTRRAAIGVDLVAVTTSLGFNLAAAPSTLGGWLVGAVAPLALFLTIMLWHRAQGVLAGWLGHLFNLGLCSVAGMAGVLSFDHIRHVAVTVGGQTPTGGAVLALVVDVLAVLAALVVIGTGHRIEDLEAAERQAEADAIEAAERAEVERVEAERLAVVEAERVEAERVERERLAEIEAETERQRIAAEADAARAALEAEKAAAERARLDSEAETARLAAAETERAAAEAAAQQAAAERLAALAAPVNGSGANGKARTDQGGSVAVSGADRDQLIADYLTANPEATQGEIAAALGVSGKTVQRSAPWRDHQATRTADPTTNGATPAHA